MPIYHSAYIPENMHIGVVFDSDNFISRKCIRDAWKTS